MEPCRGCEAAVRRDQSALLRREDSQGGRRRVKEDIIGHWQSQIVISRTIQKDFNHYRQRYESETDVKFNFVKSDRVPDLWVWTTADCQILLFRKQPFLLSKCPEGENHWWTESAELSFATLVTWAYLSQELHSRDLTSSICLCCVDVLNPKWQVKWRIVFTIYVTEEAMVGLGSDKTTKSCCRKGEKARKTRFWKGKRGEKLFQDGAFPRGCPFNSIQVIFFLQFSRYYKVIK